MKKHKLSLSKHAIFPKINEMNSSEQDKSIQISITKARYLQCSKGEDTSYMVKVEFGNHFVGESSKVACFSDSTIEFNYRTNLNLTFDNPFGIHEISPKPVVHEIMAKTLVITVLEINQKDVKFKLKGDKENAVGECSFDLIPLVRGETEITKTLIIKPVPGYLRELTHPEAPKPEIDIKVTVSEPLLKASELNDGNFMKITVGSLYSPPDTWNLQAGDNYIYTTAMTVPISDKKEIPFVFVNGALNDADLINKKNRSRSTHPHASTPSHTFEKDIFSDRIEDEVGDLMGEEDKDHRNQAETEKTRVTWNSTRQHFIESSAVKSFREKIAQNRYWPVEIFRLLPSQKEMKDDNGISFHGLAFLNLSKLLYPGVKSILGAFKIYPYTDETLYEKTHRSNGISEKATRLALYILKIPQMTDRVSLDKKSPTAKTASGEENKDIKTLQRKMSTPSEIKTIQGNLSNFSDSDKGQQYLDAKSYIMIEICLDKPLVPKRSVEVMARRVAMLVPPRPALPRRTDRAELAVKEYHGQVATAANEILEEFRELFGKEFQKHKPPKNEDLKARRETLVAELNSSGKYLAIQDKLRHSVVKIVREKYCRSQEFDDKQKLQNFISELYVYLIDQMHVSLNDVLLTDHQLPVPESLNDITQLKHYAKEAEFNHHFDLAATYYRKIITKNKTDPNFWFDYGTFNLYINDITKAEECFKECIAIDQKHLTGILLYGVVFVLNDEYKKAETFFEAATHFEPESILAWTMLGLFYDFMNYEVGAEIAYSEANKLNLEKSEELAQGVSLERIQDGELTPEQAPSIFIQAVTWLLEVKAISFAEKALSHELIACTEKPRTEYLIPLVRLRLLKEEYEAAEETLHEALKYNFDNPQVWCLMGHIKYMMGNNPEARDCYERTVAFVNDASDIHLIYTRLATIYLEEKRYQDAKRTFLLACKKMPLCCSWLGLGIACYRLGEFSEAEDALCEANFLNNNNPDVWAYLALVCLRTKRKFEAEQAYKYAVKLKIDDVALLAEIHKEQLAVGFGST